MDIGGTYIKYSLMDLEFNEEQPCSVPTRKDPEEFIEQLYGIVNEVKDRISGIAISMGGFIDPETCGNTDFSVGENFKRYNLKDSLSSYSGLPVSVENDSNCAALAEHRLGAGRGCSDLCMITLGTGIGGAIILNNELYRGRNYKAGEFGFSFIGREKSDNTTVYHAASATSILVKRISAALGQTIDGYYIFENMEHKVVREIYEEWLEDLAILVGNTAVGLDPEKLLIGGGISAQEQFICDLRNKVYQIFRHLEEYTKIEACSMGNNAGKIGALLEFFNRYKSLGVE
jgi:beta-glucoside kinase